MDWNMFWNAVIAASTVVGIVAGLFGFIRASDREAFDTKIEELKDAMETKEKMLSQSNKSCSLQCTGKYAELKQSISNQELDLNAKLSEAEFRRFEVRYEKALESIQLNTTVGFEKIESKLDDRFDRLYKLMLEKHGN